MKSIYFLVLLLMMSILSTYSNEPIRDNAIIEQASLLFMKQIGEKTTLTNEQEKLLKEAFCSYLESRERVFAETSSSQKADFVLLKELYKEYKEVEKNILTDIQQDEIYRKANTTQEDVSTDTPSRLSKEVLAANSIIPSGNITYRDIYTPQSVSLSYYETLNGPIAYYVDFGTDNCVTVEWEINFLYPANYVEIYAVDSKGIWNSCLHTIKGVSSGSLRNSTTTNGRLVVYISKGEDQDAGNISHAPLNFTFKKSSADDITFFGHSYFGGNVGIMTESSSTNPDIALEVNGVAQASELQIGGADSRYLYLDALTSYAKLFTDRPYFYFNKPIRAYQGQLGSYGTTNLQLQTNGTSRMTILNSNGNVGIGVTTPSEALEVKGSIKLRTSNADNTENEFTLSASNTSYTFFNTNSYSFLFNQAILSTNGEFGTYDGNDISFLTRGDTKMTIQHETGNVGIGTTSPNATLEVYKEKNPSFNLRSKNGFFEIGHASSATAFAHFAKPGDVVFRNLRGTNNMIFYIPNDNNDGNASFKFGDSANDGWFSIFNNKKVGILGNVGIGTDNPKYELDVLGTIRALEVVISTEGADFVFEEGYRLPTLREVEKHITDKKHLPEIPSAKEMKENGVGMAELQIKLLQKIEELTLYIIQQQKKMDELEKKVNANNQ